MAAEKGCSVPLTSLAGRGVVVLLPAWLRGEVQAGLSRSLQEPDLDQGPEAGRRAVLILETQEGRGRNWTPEGPSFPQQLALGRLAAP